MLDIGFAELIVIAVVGLIVLGPEKLPVVTRTVGTLLGRAQRYVSDVKNDISRQMELEELRKMQSSMETMGRDMQTSLTEATSDLEGIAKNTAADVNDSFSDGAFESSAYASSAFKSGLHIGAGRRTWTEEQADERLRARIQTRLRRRYMKKKPRYGDE